MAAATMSPIELVVQHKYMGRYPYNALGALTMHWGPFQYAEEHMWHVVAHSACHHSFSFVIIAIIVVLCHHSCALSS
jgi:hypothetical protein